MSEKFLRYTIYGITGLLAMFVIFGRLTYLLIPIVIIVSILFYRRKKGRWPLHSEDPADWWKKGKKEDKDWQL